MNCSKILVNAFFFLTTSAAIFQINTMQNIDKEKLFNIIKNDVYRRYVYAMGIIKTQEFFDIQSQGNQQLEEDLITVYGAFWQPKQQCQPVLDSFCTKWELEKINLTTLHQEKQ